MNEHLLELARRHGALKARIDAQRVELAQHARPLAAAFGAADKAVDGVDWLKHNPVVVGAAVAVLAILKPARAWRWAKRGIFVWRGWKKVKNSLTGGR